jgi:serine/threonine-protein kinase
MDGQPEPRMSDTHPERGPKSAPTGAPAVVRGGAAATTVDQESEADALIGQKLAGRYDVRKQLGAGGMGAVYLGEHVHMKKSVAIKVLHREMTYLPEVVARFEREAVAAARIEHPNVAAATDFGRLEDGSFYLVLEYVEGRSLSKLVRERGNLAPEMALRITRQIAEALGAAHAAGIVHRDLKPDNVMLVEKDGNPFFVKVLDFGIAKVQGGDAKDQLTQLGSVFGTPEYMAPEQAAGTPVDARADLYTLGILLYEMISGSTPFADEDLVVVLTRQMTMDPPPLPAEVDRGVSDLVTQLLQKDPDARPQSALEVVQHIEALLERSLTPSPVSIGAPMSRTQVEFGDTVLSMANPSIGQPQPPPSVAIAGTAGPSTIDTLMEKVRAALPALKRQVPIGGQPVPVWGLLAAFGAVIFFGVLLVGGLAVSAGGSASASASAPQSVEELPDDVRETTASAMKGDRTAIAQLEARPEADRAPAEWRALGRGYTLIGNRRASLAAYGKALELDPPVAKDKQLVSDVRKAAADASSSEQALTLAARHLGETGADLIYDVYTENRGKSGDKAIAKRASDLLESPAIRVKASQALQVALDLASAKGCNGYRDVLPRAAQHADARSLGKLKTLSQRRGCGFFGMRDCWSCLRKGDDLKNALEKAEANPAPTF